MARREQPDQRSARKAEANIRRALAEAYVLAGYVFTNDAPESKLCRSLQEAAQLAHELRQKYDRRAKGLEE